MKILNFNKKTPFKVLGIDENSSDKYRQLFDYMNGYDKMFAISVNPFMDLIADEYVEDRLLDKAGSLVDQVVKIYKEHKKMRKDYNYKMRKDNYAFDAFKLFMERIGATNITVEDFANVAAITFEEYIKDDLYSCNNYAAVASYIGYIDLKDNDKFMEILDDLCTIKEKYKEKMKDVVRDSYYYREIHREGDINDMRVARHFFDKEMEKLQMEKSEVNEEIEY